MKTIHMVALALVLALLLPAQAQATSISAGVVAGGGVANIYADDGTPLIINQGAWVDPSNPAAGMEIGQYVADPETGKSLVNYVGPNGMGSSITTPEGTVSGYIVPDPNNLPDPLVGSQLGEDLQDIASGNVLNGIPRGNNSYGFDVQASGNITEDVDVTLEYNGVDVTPTQNSFLTADELETDDVVTQVGTGSTAKEAGAAIPQMVEFSEDFGKAVEAFDPSAFFSLSEDGVAVVG
jgi:hypothetical protein